ncbi:MAG: hypothetical protein NTW86_03540 [Candidatus Sumerlaeota bacterium]|nr:hypothetical protein [Candidatus Sumerlaeota bacterium]
MMPQARAEDAADSSEHPPASSAEAGVPCPALAEGQEAPRLWQRVRRRWLHGLLLALALAALVVGWKAFWFLTDDAYIAFRYVRNSLLGYGYVWNPPPFRPVEGYTSFLWVLLLDGVWRVTGVEPPRAANWLSLAFSAGSLCLAALLVMRTRVGPSLARFRPALLALVLAGIVGNTTFLMFSSSGLETAMFNFWFLAWVFALIFLAPRKAGTLFLGCLTAALAALTRPDGVLCVAATAVWLVGRPLVGAPAVPRTRREWLAVAPLLLCPLHFLWRHRMYGEWLPNTYYAKITAAWPEAGIRYVTCFVIEYGFWAWGLMVAAWVFRREAGMIERWAWGPSVLTALGAPEAAEERLGLLGRGIAMGVLLFQCGYYSLLVGGDHFEYRIFSHLIPLLFVSLPWLASRLTRKGPLALSMVALCVALSYPIPWTLWSATRHLDTRSETFHLRLPVADRFPVFARKYMRWFDRMQYFLIDQSVCCRRQEHKVFCTYQLSIAPTRVDWDPAAKGDIPVFAFGCIGVYGWRYPDINIIDTNGLTDHVVARQPLPAGQPRAMAHERKPPPGYVEAFRPNVEFIPGHSITAHPRQEPLTAEEVREIERRFWNGEERR